MKPAREWELDIIEGQSDNVPPTSPWVQFDKNRPERQVWDGHYFLVMLWHHRGFYDREIGHALGLTQARVFQIRHKMTRKYGEACGFFDLPVKINRSDRTYGGAINPFYLEKAR